MIYSHHAPELEMPDGISCWSNARAKKKTKTKTKTKKTPSTGVATNEMH